MMHSDSQRNAVGQPSRQIGISESNAAVNLDADKINRGLAWLRRLPTLPPTSLPDVADVERIRRTLMEPCSQVWILARVAALLSPYYEKDTPQSVRKMEAEDWLEELSGYPQWAIERAVRWWKSAENPDRRKRPLEGDIAAICRREVDVPKTALRMLEFRRNGRDFTPPDDRPRERVSAERSAQILAEVGFAVKRMNGGSDD